MPERNNRIDLMSEDAQEVMSKIPTKILRWGITVLGVIITSLIIFAYNIKMPVTETCDFTLEWDSDEEPNIVVYIPSSAIQSLFDGHNEVVLISDAFPKEYNSKVTAKIISVNDRPVIKNNKPYYIAHVHLTSKIMENLSKNKIEIFGTAIITTGHAAIIDNIFKQFKQQSLSSNLTNH